MKRVMRLAVLMLPLVASLASADPTQWWNEAYNGSAMLNKEQGATWLANKGDTMTRIVMQTYGIPADKISTINKVIDAVVAYNNALGANKDLYNANKVTLIPNRDSIRETKLYFVPDPRSIDRILKGEDPTNVLKDSLTNTVNAKQAQGDTSATPMHATGPISTDASDADATQPSIPPTVSPGPAPGASVASGAAPDAPILGGWNGRNGPGTGTVIANDRTAARTDMLGVASLTGPQRADGATDGGDTAVERNHRGNITLMCAWDYVNAEPATKKDPLKGSAKTGVSVGVNN